MSGPRCVPALALALAIAATPALAQKSSDERVRAFAALPNWTGIWIADDGVMTELGLSGRPPGGDAQMAKVLLGNGIPYSAAGEARVEQQRATTNRALGKECGFPFPFVMESPWVFELLITPEETAMIVGGREIRHIYTDGRLHPGEDDLWPSPWGDSIGRWDGYTLLIDTIGVQPSHFPPTLTEHAHFTEQLRMVNADRLEDRITIEDPESLTKPWTITIPYKRVANLNRMVHGDCAENDRNPVVDGKLTIAPR